MNTREVELCELSSEEMESVSGGLIPVFTFVGYQALGALITYISGVKAVSVLANDLISKPSSGGGGSKRGPAGRFISPG